MELRSAAFFYPYINFKKSLQKICEIKQLSLSLYVRKEIKII